MISSADHLEFLERQSKEEVIVLTCPKVSWHLRDREELSLVTGLWLRSCLSHVHLCSEPTVALFLSSRYLPGISCPERQCKCYPIAHGRGGLPTSPTVKSRITTQTAGASAHPTPHPLSSPRVWGPSLFPVSQDVFIQDVACTHFLQEACLTT